MKTKYRPGYQTKSVWRHCGKSLGNAKFCPECGAARPKPDDAKELLAYYQFERDLAERTAKTWRAKERSWNERAEATTAAEEADYLDRLSEEHGEDFSPCTPTTYVREGRLREAEQSAACAFAKETKAAYFAKIAAVLSDLMLRAGYTDLEWR